MCGSIRRFIPARESEVSLRSLFLLLVLFVLRIASKNMPAFSFFRFVYNLFKILSDSGYYWFNTTDFPLDEIIIEESQTAPIELENFIFVNGQYEPKITVEQGKWYRWRMVMSSTQDAISKSPPPRIRMLLFYFHRSSHDDSSISHSIFRFLSF